MFCNAGKANHPSAAETAAARSRDGFYLSLDYGSMYNRQKASQQKDKKAEKSEKPSAVMISESLKAMPSRQRERLYYELHGVESEETADGSGNEPESGEQIHQHLIQMQLEISRFRKNNPRNRQLEALNIAESRNPSFVYDPAFRTRFLRCERWDATKAAARFIRHLDWKLELFGEAKLTRDITMDDLQPEDLAMLYKGYTQRLPVRDSAGRAIYVNIWNGQEYHSPQSLARIYYYMGCNCDEETERKGVVLLAFKIRPMKFATPTNISEALMLHRGGADLPVRWVVTHKFFECEGTELNQLMDSVVGIIFPEYRAKVRMHYGKHTEWIYTLMTFGFPYDLIPLDATYNMKIKNHTEYLSMRKAAEALAVRGLDKDVQVTDLPTKRDVLLGKGKPIQFSAGNMLLFANVESELERYYNGSSKERTALIEEILNRVKASGGHFLSKASGIWTAVGDELAQEKIGSMFRHQLRKNANKPKPTTKTENETAPRPRPPSDSSSSDFTGKRIRL